MPAKNLALIDVYFKPVKLRKKAFLWKEGEICSVIGFLTQGAIRHFFCKDGEEKKLRHFARKHVFHRL
ncbi:hypothetical protein [Adhaeribacter aerolatus]|nr:hypothetical protein [Adhaeribacter aerolatus]